MQFMDDLELEELETNGVHKIYKKLELGRVQLQQKECPK